MGAVGARPLPAHGRRLESRPGELTHIHTHTHAHTHTHTHIHMHTHTHTHTRARAFLSHFCISKFLCWPRLSSSAQSATHLSLLHIFARFQSSFSQISSCAKGEQATASDRFLGGHCHFANTNVSKTYSNLPPHTHVRHSLAIQPANVPCVLSSAPQSQ